MFEPVHGSAPDIAGKGMANPMGQIWTGKMMLDFMGYNELGTLVLDALEETLMNGDKTRDLGGTNSMNEVTNRVIANLQKRA